MPTDYFFLLQTGIDNLEWSCLRRFSSVFVFENTCLSGNAKQIHDIYVTENISDSNTTVDITYQARGETS